jgi:hypothetical protein
METKELRLNNLFIDGKTNTVISVIGLTEEIITFSGHFKNDWKAKPILLTEESLLYLGAIKIPKSKYHVTLYCFQGSDSNKWCVGFIDNNWFLFEGESDAFCNAVNYCKLKYIHELQNLLFAIDKVELTKQ